MWGICHLIFWWCGELTTSDLTQRSGLITRVASDLSQARQKYPCTVRGIIRLQQHHIRLVHFDMMHGVVCLICVGIVSKLSARSLAWINEPNICCSPNLMASQYTICLSNHTWVCSVLQVRSWDVVHVLCWSISQQSHRQPVWTVLVLCCVSKG